MKAAWMLHKRRMLFLVILFAAGAAFTADILDLRDELRFVTCPYSSLDSNITAGVACLFAITPAPVITSSPVQGKTSVEVSFIHLLPYGFRAPPALA
jgi:hypothetical protein